MSLKDALLKAYAESGQVPPVKEVKDHQRVVLARGSKGQSQLVVVRHGPSTGGKASKAKSASSQGRKGKKYVAPAGQEGQAGVNNSIKKKEPKSVKGPVSVKADGFLQQTNTKTSIPAPKGWLEVNAKCLIKLSSDNSNRLLDLDLALGYKDSIDQLANPEVHDMALGLDFGTSSVKVVIGDLSSDKAYAVPFLEADGVDAYLLPSRVFESNAASAAIDGGSFSLSQGEHAFRDLKLSLLGNPDSVDRQVEVIAFLALVIQRSRAWLFQTHKAIYKRVKCIWQLRIGLPAASALDNKYVPLLEKVLRAAWLVAEVWPDYARVHVQCVRDRVFDSAHQDDELEVRVIPEIAAQIFGFVVSNSFDRNAANRYLMVDVGAGTVDSSLFRVFPGRGGQWNFEFYTAVVQPHGVSNLHAYRVDWWTPRLTQIEDSDDLVHQIIDTKFATDIGVTVPVHNRDYFEGVHLANDSPDQGDLVFFEKLMGQVQGSTMWRAWKDGFLDKDQLTHTPMFLCGGGARSDYYLKLENALVRMPSFAWLSADPWRLGFPGDLEANGVGQKDFDRLSVAYGLSKLNVGRLTQALPLPKVQIEASTPFTDRYIDKDQT